MKLPFLDDTKWPGSREPGERVVNPSYDSKIEDQLIDELLVALTEKSVTKLRETLQALIQHLKSDSTDAM